VTTTRAPPITAVPIALTVGEVTPENVRERMITRLNIVSYSILEKGPLINFKRRHVETVDSVSPFMRDLDRHLIY
jgi:hypothetical protein